MTDGQLAALVTAIVAAGGTVGGVLKWAVQRVVTSNDASTAAIISNTASNAVLSVKVDALVVSNKDLGTKLDNIGDWMETSSGVRSIPTPRQPKVRDTPARGIDTGYAFGRGGTKGDER